MKTIAILLSLLFAFAGNAQKIIMRINNITGPQDEEILAFDWKNTAIYPDGSIGGGGGGTAKADPGLIMIKKEVAFSSNRLMKALAASETLSEEVVFEFYSNNTDKVPYYIIKLANAVVKQFYYLAPECPTCLKLVHQIGFSPGTKVFFENKLLGQSNVWNIAENTTQ